MSDGTNPAISIQDMQPMTRGECAAKTSRMFAIVGGLEESIKQVADRVGESTTRMEKITSDMATEATERKTEKAYADGLKDGSDDTKKSAASIRKWILGALTAACAVASAVWWIAERMT